MKVGVFAVLFAQRPLGEALDYIKATGCDAVEIGAGGYPGAAHCDSAALLADPAALDAFRNEFTSRGLEISAISCHGNPLHPDKSISSAHDKDFRNAVLLAEKLGVQNVITFSGCPGDSETSRKPNWVTCPWPTDYLDILEWQWEQVARPYWSEAASYAGSHNVRVAIELHPGFLAYHTESFWRLREIGGNAIGVNFDPSHLFWQGMDPLVCIRELGDAIYHVHMKDTWLDGPNIARNGVLDTKKYTDEKHRSWIFRTVGYGHGQDFWRAMISELRLAGYDGSLSIEHEDSIMSVNEGFTRAVNFLKDSVITEQTGGAWWVRPPVAERFLQIALCQANGCAGVCGLEGRRTMAEIGVGLVGYKFMGRAHSNGYRQVAHFFDVDPAPKMVAICGRDEAAVSLAAKQLGWAGYETDYHKLIARDDIGLIDVSTPGNTHREVVLAALAAGKHVLCEKPLANTLDEAQEMLTAANKAGVINMINFNYRRVPAVQLAKQLIESGKIGEIRHFRAVYLQDWILDPNFPLVWRMKKELAGSGALGDIAAHIVDLSRFLVGEITSVTGRLETFIKQRPVEVTSTGGAGLEAASGAEMGDVTVDDSAQFLAQFASGATGVFEVTRLAAGRRNRNSFEINGSKGTISFDLERLNELDVYFVDDAPGEQGFRKILVTDGAHPYVGHWWPSGHIIGWEHTFVHAINDLMTGIKTGVNPTPSFADGFACQAVLDAVERSSVSERWETPVAAQP